MLKDDFHEDEGDGNGVFDNNVSSAWNSSISQ